MLIRALLPPILLVAWAGAAPAQLITIRTVPISRAHQFDIFPSNALAMGGVSIAVHDTLLDPLANPATGARIQSGSFYSSPSIYGVSSGAGGGRALPLGVSARAGSWFGGLSMALQQVDLSERLTFPLVPFGCGFCGPDGVDFDGLDRSRGNTHAFAMMGRDLTDGLSLGGSMFLSFLNAVDGVDLLYANAARINQSGNAIDLRVGILQEWAGERSLEALLLHNRFAMEHDVLYLDPLWDPGRRRFSQIPRLERNLDRTSAWGLHVEYEHPLGANGWRLGWLGTANRMSHPKIPNYEIMNIPRDPGNSSAFNVGVGISKTIETSTFGADLIYEPIWSHTWADSELPVATVLDDTIPPGGMTIENRFRFTNALLRMGVDQELDLGSSTVVRLQFGLAVRSIHYRLAQDDHVQRSSRRLDEQWAEWTPTWGVKVRLPELEIRYRASSTSGTGRPGVVSGGGGGDVLAPTSASGGNILAAPSGPLTLGEVRVMTHQISIAIPIR